MELITRTYQIIEGRLDFEFHYDSAIAEIGSFDIMDISELKYGYDSADQKEVSIYPSNISIVIDDFSGDNYKSFKSLYTSYSSTYPFNFYEKFYLEIKLNGTVIFNGIIDELESDYENKNLTLTFVDGINKYKDVQISNPDMLQYLHNKGMVPRTAYFIPGTIASYVYAYGFRRVRYWTSILFPEQVKTKGYIVDRVGNGDKAVNLSGVIHELIKILRPAISVEFSNELKFGDAEAPVEEMVTINRVWVKQILQWLLGRYIVIPKLLDHDNQIGELEGDRPEYTKPDHFKVVYETALIKVYYHDYGGEVKEEGSTFTIDKGIDEKTIAEILKVIAKNLFSYYGFKSVNTLFFKHKRYAVQATNLTDRIIDMEKSLVVDKLDYVRIDDYFTGNFGADGSNYNDSDAQVNYKIPLNTIPVGSGDLLSRMFYYDLLGDIKQAHYFYDPVTEFRDLPQEVISRSEWEAHKNFRDQYEFELSGIDYEFDKTYSVNYENYSGMFRPITIEKNLLESKTKMTALEIG